MVLDAASAGILLIVAGVAVLAVGAFLTAGKGAGTVKGGGVILVGPVPIAFGSDAKWTSVAIALAILLLVLVVVLRVGWP